MKNLFQFIVRGGLAAALIMRFSVSSGAAAIRPVSHVIHISVDGLAAVNLQDYVTHAPAQFPTFWFLVTNGASTFNARCDYDNSYTLPNHASMLTGRPVLQPAGQPNTVPHGFTSDAYLPGQNLQNSGNLHVPYKASVFDVTHDHGLSTALFSSKPKFAMYLESYDATNGAPNPYGRNKVDFNMFTDCGTNPPSYIASTPLVDCLVDRLTNAPWNYIFFHFGDTDWVGHDQSLGGGWGSPKWSNTVAYVDRQLGRIFSAIRINPALSHDTALMVTADHGGGGNLFIYDPINRAVYGYSHTDQTQPLNYTIPFFLWGPGIPAGADLYTVLTNRASPGTNRLDYNATPQPIRNGDAGNLVLALLGLPAIPGSFMLPELNTVVYPLGFRRAGPALTVSWPAGATGYVLESSEALGPRAVWQEIHDAITTTGVSSIYTVPDVSQSCAQFFRLRKKP